MAYNREEVPWAWLSVVLAKDILHYAGQKEANLCRNDDKYLANFELCLFTEDDEEIKVLAKITHVIAAMYFTTFESLIVYRNTHMPCYVSKRVYSYLVREF